MEQSNPSTRAIKLSRRQKYRRALLVNFITLLRILAVFVIILLLYLDNFVLLLLAIFLGIVASVSDWLDGYLARLWQIQTPLGQALDPIADKVFVAGILFAVNIIYDFNILIEISSLLIILREIVMSGWREHLAAVEHKIPVSLLAKWKTTIQLIGINFLIAGDHVAEILFFIPIPKHYWSWLITVIMVVSAILTVKTAYDYFINSYRNIKMEFKQ